MSYRSRVYRQRNAHQHENEQPQEEKFFSRSGEKSGDKGSKGAFFQAKPNEAGTAEDALEKEANKTANAVAKQDPTKDKKDEAIQKAATPEEDKKTATNDERMKQDKDKQSS
ncbi:hypothetical protein A3860_32685 [Niastella vici]|uniref:Uncharacterized protein n=1 Tax=Niastella vici TaxID=1703345 RepID=A0A1V9FQE5_9BACT|nr:hypothetical protein [Niastella vici]OQP60573.1 hypothetical protein A3860_32685 [Niastella vici]